jgi:hypothetical protein
VGCGGGGFIIFLDRLRYWGKGVGGVMLRDVVRVREEVRGLWGWDVGLEGGGGQRRVRSVVQSSWTMCETDRSSSPVRAYRK